jgi:hypothetical protein
LLVACKRADVAYNLCNYGRQRGFFVAQRDLPLGIRRAKRQELDQIVNGPLALVAQDKVFAALRHFYTCLDNRQCAKGSLMLYSRNVARACRTSIEESWQVSLPSVQSSDTLP